MARQHPAQSVVISPLYTLVQGTMPTTQRLMSIRNLLLSSSDLRSPSNLERQFRNATGILADTAKGLTSLLQVKLP